MKSQTILFHSVPDYIKTYPSEVQKILREVRSTITKIAPKAEEKISYHIPSYYLNGPLVSFAAYKKHIGFYPGAAAIAKFKKELSSYKSARGSVQFPIDAPMPLELIRKIVKFRLQVNSSKPTKKIAKKVLSRSNNIKKKELE
ncbi:hypothetical protein CH373_06315 [Leptospira perolatii]|uniref:YdhG-like domain-containing protein n=1 Tax=Leptospira perolatii TaxID=2023191 RepID=A0A2M9ZP53_9LEPT|nr:DUF1801 domain-containing protein [Leptospira perolatii]PJZ70875.1 hypothetical protein CH360_05045 [Leptospira perolatii]PJZ73771.1 hypothetical protein CH373_06315 [Leptospira perolatii]